MLRRGKRRLQPQLHIALGVTGEATGKVSARELQCDGRAHPDTEFRAEGVSVQQLPSRKGPSVN